MLGRECEGLPAVISPWTHGLNMCLVRCDDYPHWKLFFESLSEDRQEWRIAGDWNKDKINRISKVELVQAFIR